ncbi:Auxin-responsive protein SAUR36 [Cocos nucifera]|uniref:Auxin-responsive protein SAUR36 n=1 Tax=Cocos nucifera TaxID=13894 RepID=A0A8K0N776_COCNU|nr:Auxin-responsive protein SAUR36 [Cocos nucifera]
MINSKRVGEMTKKWQKVTSLGRRRFSVARSGARLDSNACSTSVADKGHFIVYTSEGKRFMVPLAFLDSRIFQELFRMSEEVFGSPGDGPIMLPCDAVFMEYATSLLRRRVPQEVERALLDSLSISHHSECSFLPLGLKQQLVVCCS